MTRAVWDYLLAEVKSVYTSHAEMTGFAPFPTDIAAQPVEAFDPGCGAHFARAALAPPEAFAALTQAIKSAGPSAKWRETYKGTSISPDFMERFGCYSIIGEGGAFTSAELWLWMVYMPAHLDYPFHHHPGEEMYLVLDGEAEFRRKGQLPEICGAGRAIFHASNQSHAMETFDHSVLCLVAWRNGFETPPVWTGTPD